MSTNPPKNKTILFFLPATLCMLTILLCAFNMWLQIGAIGYAIFSKRILSSSQLTEESSHKVEQNSNFPYFAADYKIINANNTQIRIKWPNVSILQRAQDKFSGYLEQIKNSTPQINETFVNLNSLAQFVLLRGAIRTNESSFRFIKRSEDGYLYNISDIKLKNMQCRNNNSESFSEFLSINELVKSYGANMLYCSVITYNNLQMTSEEHFMSPFQQREREIMSHGIDIMSFPVLMQQDGLDFKNYIFKTDHHWKPEAAFWAFTKLAQYYSKYHNISVPKKYTNIENYHQEIFSARWLGSFGRFVGKEIAGLDDFSLIYPKFPTSFELSIPICKFSNQGEFKDVFLNIKKLENKDYNNNIYVVYMGGDYPIVQIKNYNAPNKKRLLIVRDSFTCVLAPYISLLFSETHLIDPRLATISVRKYITDMRPDFVIYIASPVNGYLSHSSSDTKLNIPIE